MLWVSCILVVLICSRAPADLNAGLMLYYGFDTNQGSVVIDQSGQGHTGTVLGAVWTNSGFAGGAYSFDGNSSIDCGNVLDLASPTSALTACAWIKVDTSSTNACMAVVGKNQEPSPYTGWMLDVDLTRNMAAADLIAVYPERSTSLAPRDVLDGQWHHLAAVFENTSTTLTTTIYVDGEKVASNLFVGSHGSTVTTSDLMIGRRTTNGAWPFVGLIDEVRIYNRALSPDEVKDLHGECANLGDAVTQVGFSYEPYGDQDMTYFLSDETLYVKVQDVDLTSANPLVRMRATVMQYKTPGFSGPPPAPVIQDLQPQANGCFTGAIPLSSFRAGQVLVMISGDDQAGTALQRTSKITVAPAPPTP